MGLLTLDAALKVPALLPLDGESPSCPTWFHPSDLVRNVEEGMYCKRGTLEVVQACAGSRGLDTWIESAFIFWEREERMYHS